MKNDLKMLSGEIKNFIRIIERPGFNLKTGDYITINIIKHLVGQKWAIGYKGRVFSAITDISLFPGQKIGVIVQAHGNKLLFKIADDQADIKQKAVKSIAGFDLDRIIQESLVKSYLPLNELYYQKIKKILKKYKIYEKSFVRLLAILLNKKIDLSSEGIKPIIEIFHQFKKEKKLKNKPLKEEDNTDRDEEVKSIIDYLKNIVTGAGQTQRHPLQLFNHLKGDEVVWICIPYSLSSKSKELYGMIKICYNSINMKLKKMIIDINTTGKESMSFLLNDNNTSIDLKIISSGNDLDTGEISKNLMSKLKDFGVQYDNNIYKKENFDGFSLDLEQMPMKTINFLQ